MTASSAVERPEVIIFDVNETLSDMSTMARRFEEVGAPGSLAATWFAGVLRDGFALTAAGGKASFAQIAADLLRRQLSSQQLTRSADDAVGHVMAGFMGLDVHPDVAEGLAALGDLGIRMVTLSNGSTQVAETLLERAGIRHLLERLLSVDDAPAWKPAAAAYRHALQVCDMDAGDAMLVASHPWDIDGAARAGLRTAWLNRSEASHPEYFTAPEIEVDSLVDLAAALR